jgi:tetratricopeptide (TPR) repeat protein
MWREEQTEALHLLADVYLDQGHAGRAAILLEALTVLAPDKVELLRTLSYALLLAGRYEDALAATDVLLRLDAAMPENTPALFIRSKALWALGRVAEAQENLQRYLDLESPS